MTYTLARIIVAMNRNLEDIPLIVCLRGEHDQFAVLRTDNRR
jgi:hypothetical protein